MPKKANIPVAFPSHGRSDVGIQIIDNHGSPAMSLLNCNLYDMYPISDMTQDRMYNLYIVHTPFLSLLTN